jgi:hypothetical protein
VSSSREHLIHALSENLPAVKTVGNVDRLAIGWLLVSAVYVAAITYTLGPIRPNALAQLLSEPRFLLETLSGGIAIVLLTLIAFRAAVPGRLGKGFAWVGGLVLLGWLGNYVVGLVSPALEPSMLGKRDYCVWETMVYALPPMFLGYLIMRRLYPLQPVKTAMALSLVAGMIPALYMQIACMYLPEHILKFHVLPGLTMALFGAFLAWVFRARQR